MLSAASVLLALALCASSASATVYGFAEVPQLEELNPKTGAATPLGAPLTVELQAQGLSAVDSAKKLYYLLGYNRSDTKPNLLGVSLETGKVVTAATLPFAESAFIGVGQSIDVDPSDNNIFAGGRLEAKGPHVVAKVDPATGKLLETVASFNASDLPVLGAATTFDSDSRQLFVQLGTPAGGIINFAVDVDNKKVTQIPEDPEEGRIITTMAYDPKRKLVLGLGIAPKDGSIERTLVTLDPITKQYKTVANVTGFLVESGGESALDASARVLYWIGQADGAKPTDPFHLIGLNADTGAVVSSPVLCPNDAACPWSIGVSNE